MAVVGEGGRGGRDWLFRGRGGRHSRGLDRHDWHLPPPLLGQRGQPRRGEELTTPRPAQTSPLSC